MTAVWTSWLSSTPRSAALSASSGVLPTAARSFSAPTLSPALTALRTSSGVPGLGRRHRLEHLVLPAADLLGVVGVAVEHLEERQRGLSLGHLAGHLEGRGEGHEDVEAEVVLAAERAGHWRTPRPRSAASGRCRR